MSALREFVYPLVIPPQLRADLYLEAREELGRHARMSHPDGRAFHGACLCGEWRGPNTAYQDHVAAELVSRLTREER
jgi:hypothetical protein